MVETTPTLNQWKAFRNAVPAGRAISQPAIAPAAAAAAMAIQPVAGAIRGNRPAGSSGQIRSKHRFSSGASHTYASQPPKSGKASRGNASCVSLSRSRNKSAESAGLSVSELKVEITVEAAIVSANWRKNCPVNPLMNAQGTKTALKTSPTATTGPETWLIALIVASRGARPFSM